MAYYRGKDIEKSRGNAVQEVILEKRSIAQVARRFGKNRSTIYRWMNKWKMQQNVLLENPGRPSRPLGKIFRWQSVKWNIPTLSSAPKTHPNALNAVIVSTILRIRRYRYECAEIVH